MEGRLGCPIELECDGNTAALGEFACGTALASDEDSFCMLTLGTGVGCGIVLRGEIWHGDHGMGGEAGHITVKPDGAPCGCGNEGCLEVYASATAVMRLTREAAAAGADAAFTQIVQTQKNFDAKDLFELARASNPTAQHIFDEVGNSLGLALAALMNILDVRVYLIGGGMASAWEAFAPTMIATVERRSYVFRGAREGGEARMIRVQKASLGDQAGLIGAGALPFQASNSTNAVNALEIAAATAD
jgi:glucokinase